MRCDMSDTVIEKIKCSCQSLTGYGKEVHKRSGGKCAYCDFVGDSFDKWRQLSVEHIIPTSYVGGNWLKFIKDKFNPIGKEDLSNLCKKIHEINIVTACNFCNSMTSRYKPEKGEKKEIQNLLNKIKFCNNTNEFIHLIRDLAGLIEKEKRIEVQGKMKYIIENEYKNGTILKQ